MKKQILFLLLLASSVFSQIDNQIGKTASQLGGIVSGVTVPNKSFFDNQIFQRFVEHTNAFIERGVFTKDFTSLTAAIDTANTRDVPLFVNSRVTLSSSKTVERLIGWYGGRITIAAGTTLTISTAFDALRDTVFIYSNSSTSKVLFSGGSVVQALLPEWWGARNDSTVNCGAPFQYAIDATPLRHGTLSLNGQGKGYIINTKVTFPKGNVNPREIHIEGNGAAIYSSMSDTVFVIRNMSLQSGGALLPRHSIKNVWFKRISGSEDAGVAVCVNNSVEQTVEFCHFENYAIGVLLYNSYQGNTGDLDSTGWVEVTSVSHNRFTACDTAIFLKRQYPASGTGHTGHESFATTRIEHNAIALGGAASRVGGASKNVVGIAISKHARAYRCSFDNNYFGTTQYSTAFYCDGRLDGSWGHFGMENFGSAQANSYFFDFGSNATNMGAKFFVGYEGLPGLRSFIRSASNKPLPQIETWIKGDGSGESRGITTVYKDTASTYLWSLLRSSEIDNFKASGATNDSDYTFISKVSTTRQMTVNLRREQPLQIFDLDDNLQPVRLNDIGRNRSIAKVGDSTGFISVKNATHLTLSSASSTATPDTLSRFTGGTIGQLLTVTFSDDSLKLRNLVGGTGSGRIFLPTSRDEQMIDGTKMILRAESETGGYFWRVLSWYSPANGSSWNPGNLAAGATDSTTVTVIGAQQGDPVSVGLSSIGTANANIDLKAHVVAINSVRVFATNRGAADYNIPSGTLRIKILK